PNLFVWTVTKPTGCVDSDTVQVIYNVPPTASFTATPSTGCSPIDVTYQNNSTDGSSYYWNYGEDQKWDYSIKDTTIQYIAYDNDSVYTTTLIAYSNAGCSDTISRTITAYGIPKVAILAYPTNQLYPDATVFIENNSGDGYPNYYWTFGDTETQLDNTRIPQIQHTYATWGTYEITLAVTSATCSDTARATINILAPKPTDFSSRNYYSGCQPQTVSLTAATDYADSYEWFIVDSRGDTIETSIDQNPSIIFTEAGRYYARIRATGPGGTVNVRTDTIDVFNVPEVDFIITPDTVMLPNQPIHCYNRSTYGDRYEWDFGDTSKVSFEENPLHYYTKEGIYPVTLRVYTENGCFNSKTTDVGIVVEKPGVCRFPNAFTPSISGSSDGHYDPDAVNNVVFHPKHRGIREYKLEIFNRWGEKLFESTDPTIGWDGYSNGKLAPQDVYVWKVTGKFKNGVIFKDAGDVTLLR
ncbi:MAG: PKD domain-containing protein, partial [Bacteroidales bacterium]|nr:PKD domain-containing protein [Bacteroidales bacterium]